MNFLIAETIKSPRYISRTCNESDSEHRSLKGSTKNSDNFNGHISLRQTNAKNNVSNRKHVIKMLFVIVLEYFICWSPVYVCNTWIIVDYMSIHNRLSNVGWGMILLLSYSSCFIHPITYCFMNKNFRKGFISVFKCVRWERNTKGTTRTHTEVSSMQSMTNATGQHRNDTLRMNIVYTPCQT